MRIAFAGNPNSGKTTMYNALTGRNERVGNWAGVTVEKKESPIKKMYYEGEELIAVDLPGAYSMSPFTSEESITSSYVKHENPDAIINIVDATNLSRSLFFTTQLLELGIPVVVALNKSDINEKKGTTIDAAALAAKLGCPVVKTVSTSASGLNEVVKTAAGLKGQGQKAPYEQTGVDLTDKHQVEQADRARFDFVNQIVNQVETRKVFTKEKNSQDTIDAVMTNPVSGLLIFAGVMFLVFQISQTWIGPPIADWLVGLLESFQGVVSEWMVNASPFLQSLVVDGIIGGVSAVIGFLPLVMVMYFLIALLEDCGYMARATVVLDPIFKKVGLSGKSVIPFVIGTGCGIPAIMACRTIRNERERRSTAMLATFMPCGAKMPVIALFVGAFFPNAGWVAPMMYFVGIALILVCALLVNAITGYKVRKSFFIIELPEYSSILATIAHPFAYLLIPIVGVLSWQLAAAAVTGFIAKENVVGTLAVCFVGLENLIDTEELAMMEGAGAEVATVVAITKVAALAYLMFNLFTPPCFAAIGAMRSELKSGKWLAGAICLQLAVGYTVGFLVFQIGTLITTGTLGAGFLPGLIAVLCFAAVIVYLIRRTNRGLAAEYALGTAK